MKKVSLLIISVMANVFSYAQDNGKTSIAIAPFSESQGTINLGKGPQIFSQVSGTFDASKRFSIMPTDNWGLPQDATEASYVSQAKDLGITYMIFGAITTLSVTKVPAGTDANGNPHYSYSSHITFSLKVVNTETGALFNSKIFTVGSGFLNQLSQQAAADAAIRHISPDVKKWISETFPVNVGLVKIIKKDDKGGALTVLISAGSESGLTEGKGRKIKPTRFKIVEYVSENVDGRIMKRTAQIGEAEVDKIDDENFSECIVTDGRMDVAKKVDAGGKLFLVTIN